MKIEFDKEADALYIRFQPGKVGKSIKVRDGIIMDIGKDGRVFGLEILDASRRIPLTHIQHINLSIPVSTRT